MVSCYTGDAMNEWMDKQRFIKKYNQFFFKETEEASLIMPSIYSTLTPELT